MKKGIAVIWAVLMTVIIMGGAGGGAWYYLDLQNTKDKDVMKKEIIALENQIKDLSDEAAKNEADDATDNTSDDNDVVEADPYLYTNSTYGFTLQFNSLWQGYQMKQANLGGSTKTYYVCVPTTDPLYTSASSTSLAGTVSIFALSVYTQAQWTAATAEEGPVPTKVGQSGSWIIGYSMAQAFPEDKAPLASNLKTVVATFKAI